MKTQDAQDEAFIEALRRFAPSDAAAGRISPEELYASITQVEWIGPNGERSGFSYRGAIMAVDDLLGADATAGGFDYYHDVSPLVAERMATLGWTWRERDLSGQPATTRPRRERLLVYAGLALAVAVLVASLAGMLG